MGDFAELQKAIKTKPANNDTEAQSTLPPTATLEDNRKEAELLAKQQSLMQDPKSSPNFHAFIDDVQEDLDYDVIEQEEEEILTTQDGYQISPAVPPKEKRVLSQYGDKMIKNVGEGASVAKTVKTSIGKLDEAEQHSGSAKAVLDSTEETFIKAAQDTSISGLISIIGGFAKPIASGISGIVGAMTKWEQWSAFEKAVFVDPKAKIKVEKPKAPEEAKYGLTKVWKGFVRKIKDVIMAVSNFTANLLMLIPGAQIVAGPWKVFNAVADYIEKVYTGAKSIFQFFKGEKKEENSASLLDSAIAGKEDSLQLILDLKLSSISGSWEDKEEKWYSVSSATKDKVASGLANVKNKARSAVGLNQTEGGAKRIIDVAGWGSGGPQSTQALHELLKSYAADPDSRKLILTELKEAMTGYGK